MRQTYFVLTMLLFLPVALAAQTPYTGTGGPMTRQATLDSLEAVRDSIRAAQAGVDSLASAVRDTLKVYLPAYLIKGPSVELFGDTAQPDSLVISSTGTGGPGGGYVDYWNWTFSDSLTVPYAAATDLDLPSVTWPGKPDGAKIYKAYPMFRIWHLRNPSASEQFIDVGTFRAKHPSGAWGVDDILSLSMNNSTSFLRFLAANRLSTSEMIGGLDISGILADTAHAVNLRFEDIKAYGAISNNLTEMVVQTGLRVWYGDRPQSEIVWGWFPNSEAISTAARTGVDSILVTVPDGASIERAYVLVNVYSALTSTGADTVFTANSGVGIAATGGAYTTGLTIPWTRFPKLNPVSASYGRGMGVYVGATDLKAVVSGAGSYALNAGPVSHHSSASHRVGWQGGLLLTYTY